MILIANCVLIKILRSNSKPHHAAHHPLSALPQVHALEASSLELLLPP